MKKEEIRVEYKVMPYTITAQNVEMFETLDNRRQLRDSHISMLHGLLLKDKPFAGTFAVNRRNGHYRVIDGNHRLEAIKRFYKYKPENSLKNIQTWITVYENLTDDKETEVYSQIQAIMSESYEDLIQHYRDAIPLWRMIQESEFPCKVSIYGAKQGIKFRQLLNALAIIRSQKFSLNKLRKNSIISFSQSLEKKDFEFLKVFLTFFMEVFGKIEKPNPYCKEVLFFPIIDIYYRNLERVGIENLKQRFGEVIGKQPVLSWLSLAGREASMQARKIMIDIMNKGYTKKLVI